MSGAACAGCRRVVALRGRSPDGPTCSACCAARHTGRCAGCGREQRLVGRDRSGRPWCTRCRARDIAAEQAGRHRAVLVTAVTAADPGLPGDVAAAVIEGTVGVRRLRSLAEHVTAHPDVLTVGPTSQPPVLHRLVLALQAAGAPRLRVIHPTCSECGRPRPAQLRTSRGVLCGACYARTTSVECASCGRNRRVSRRGEDGRPLCDGCVSADRAEGERASLTAQLLGAVSELRTGLDERTVAAVLDRSAPRRFDRCRLLQALEEAGQGPQRWPLPVARLVAGLRAAGAAGLPPPSCNTCREGIGQEVVVLAGRLLCTRCARQCPGCGRPVRTGGEGRCGRCRRDTHRVRGACGGCGGRERLLDGRGRCRYCREAATRWCVDCRRAGPHLTAVGKVAVCQACVLRRDVDVLLPAGGRLDRPQEAVLAAEPLSTRRWLARGPVRELLADCGSRQRPLSHGELDALPPSRGVEHLRALLVAVDALPADHTRPLTALENDVEALLAPFGAEHRRLVRAWLRWRVLPRLRRGIDEERDMTTPVRNVRRDLGQVLAFLALLDGGGRQLRDCRQLDLDAWFAQPGAIRHRLRPFLAWAQRTRQLPEGLTLPGGYRSRPATPADAEHRWATARRLVADDTLGPADRVAGALVILYAQPLTRIVTLTTGDLRCDAGTVGVRLSGDQLELPEPFASLITGLPRHRRRGVVEQLDSPWLFPGQRAGQHLSPTRLGYRLRAIGIQPRAARAAALTQLSTEVPPAMLAGVLGLAPATAVRWAGQSGGDWARYAASRGH